MQLKTGCYYISTIATSPWGERWVQRDTVEDKTMLPKPVNIQVDEAGAAEVSLLLRFPDQLHKQTHAHTATQLS
jgi:hypothetical protein